MEPGPGRQGGGGQTLAAGGTKMGDEGWRVATRDESGTAARAVGACGRLVGRAVASGEGRRRRRRRRSHGALPFVIRGSGRRRRPAAASRRIRPSMVGVVGGQRLAVR